MDKSYVPCILTELRFVISQMRILGPNRTYINTPKEDVTTFLSRAIALIEWLDGALEDCEEAAKEDESLVKNWKNRCHELVCDRDRAVEYWAKHCENLLQTHRESLAAKDHEIYELKSKLNNPMNFCGNCKHYAQMGKDNDTYEGICTQHYIKRVDPDDASCEHFKSNQPDRVVIDKPEFPCCKHCNHEDCDDCTLCPF